MILPNQEIDDARPTLLISHKKNIHSVFSGKVTTCVSAAKRIIDKDYNINESNLFFKHVVWPFRTLSFFTV